MKFFFSFLCVCLGLACSTIQDGNIQAGTPVPSSQSNIPMPDCIIPGTEIDCNELVAELPWLFNIDVKDKKPIRITYLSSQGMQQSKLHLKIYLEISDYENLQAATEDFSQMYQKADPDMGISYGWDFVIIRAKYLYRLHADCTLAQYHFDATVLALERVVGSHNKHTSKTLFCRCGGGCRLSE